MNILGLISQLIGIKTLRLTLLLLKDILIKYTSLRYIKIISSIERLTPIFFHKIFFLKKNKIDSSITNRLLSNIYFSKRN